MLQRVSTERLTRFCFDINIKKSLLLVHRRKVAFGVSHVRSNHVPEAVLSKR